MQENKANKETLALKETSKKDIFTNEDKIDLDKPGKIDLAKLHSQVQLTYKPLCNLQKLDNLESCPCCHLPWPKKGVLEHFSICSNNIDYSVAGIGVYLYFYFFLFIQMCVLIALCISAIPTIILSHNYTQELMSFCTEIYDNSPNFLEEHPHCAGFIRLDDPDIPNTFDERTDWILRYNSDNIKTYRTLYISLYSSEEIDSTVTNYSLINFITMAVLFFFNMAFIILVRMKSINADFSNVTPGDFTLIVTNWKNLSDDFIDYKVSIKNANCPWEASDIKEFTKYIHDIVLNLQDNDNVLYLNLCFKIEKYLKLENQRIALNKEMTLITTAHKQVEWNKEIADPKQRYYHGMKCWGKRKTYGELELQLKQVQSEITKLFMEATEVNKDHFGGTLFVVFKTIRAKEVYWASIPKGILSSMWYRVRHLHYYLCKCFISKRNMMKFKYHNKISIKEAPEPEEIIWENLEYTFYDRVLRRWLVFGISLLLIGLSFGIVLAFNYLQFKADTEQWNTNLFIAYFISLTITVVISVWNIVFQNLLDYLTKLEKNRTRTDFYLSLSVKLTIFTFVNSAVVPLGSNYLQYSWGENDTLIYNIWMIFISNALVTPLLWLFNIPYIFNRLQIYLLHKKEKPDETHHLTQRELNTLYDYPSMDISYKYSYLTKTILMTFLYIPIFPLGVPISLFGLVLGYCIEKYNFANWYKRPEMWNDKICKFYVNQFWVVTFCFGVGNWIFSNDTFSTKAWALVDIIVFGIIIIFPFSRIWHCNFIQFTESIWNSDEYGANFNTDYDYKNTNPMKHIENIIEEIQKLKKKGVKKEMLEMYANKISLAYYCETNMQYAQKPQYYEEINKFSPVVVNPWLSYVPAVNMANTQNGGIR